MRTAYRWCGRLVYLAAGWYWLGGSGVGLIALWLQARSQSRAAVRTEPIESGRARWRAFTGSDQITFVHCGPWRIVLKDRTLGRVEVYRDEVSPADWARLRRGAFGPQPATGRNRSNSSA